MVINTEGFGPPIPYIYLLCQVTIWQRNSYGNGYGDGNGNGYGDGDGYGNGYGDGDGNGYEEFYA